MSTAEPTSDQIPPGELERYRDAEWALHDPGVQRGYEGKWVVAYQRKIIAHGADPSQVVEQARQVVTNENHRAVFCAADEPHSYLDHTPDSDVKLLMERLGGALSGSLFVP